MAVRLCLFFALCRREAKSGRSKFCTPCFRRNAVICGSRGGRAIGNSGNPWGHGVIGNKGNVHAKGTSGNRGNRLAQGVRGHKGFPEAKGSLGNRGNVLGQGVAGNRGNLHARGKHVASQKTDDVSIQDNPVTLCYE